MDAIKQRNTLRLTEQSNRVEYLVACGEVRRLSEEARRTKWEECTAFNEPLIHNGRTFLTNTEKANANKRYMI